MKAVIPAAGFGTRFLPLTKAQPKEMLPVVNKPTIQWVVEEAVDAGITDIAIITGDHKQAIEHHFKPMEKLEKVLEKAGKTEELKEIRKINEIANLEFIVQEEQKGLGHAILCAEDFVGNDSFAVLLGDTICTGNPNCTKGLVNLFYENEANIFSVEEISLEETKRYGVVLGKEVGKGIMLVKDLVEKPEPNDAPSLLGIQGRYVFTSDIFEYLKLTRDGADGEIQLTDAMKSLANTQLLYSWIFNGKRYDIGTMKDWFQSHLELSIESEFSLVLKGVMNKL
ncbi:MAG: UTP--glucose-1-phosphate uridylyltransferase [Marine Group III euryarchaeote CG-Epi1]|uniref:UTP--glucose-1-phosphate uridylyltransferase n=1 Tax=Marine Group III euryarchaeote CG-Epi1 TaxID=1888995 RepID=A0A1J5TM03_9ARCH|nr:MAG: UTP--glucose-1-phosphate uridylyltransferase [Marine Group III euryarchaeote CG-Epi1]